MLVSGVIAAPPMPAVAAEPSPEYVKVASEEGPMAANLRKLTPLLMALPEVVGVGEGRCGGKPCIKVFVTEKSRDLSTRIHEIVGDEPVDIVESGEIRAR